MFEEKNFFPFVNYHPFPPTNQKQSLQLIFHRKAATPFCTLRLIINLLLVALKNPTKRLINAVTRQSKGVF